MAYAGERTGTPPWKDPLLPTPRLIALSGYGHVGKDTAAATLVEDGWTRVAFADRLKELALRLNPLISSQGWTVHLATLVESRGWQGAKKEPAVRELLQHLGDGAREVLAPDVWVNPVFADLPDGDVVITDCRHPNEAARVKLHGGLVIRVRRPGVGPANGHISETALDAWPFDAFVENDREPAVAGARLREVVDRYYAAATP